MPLDNRPFAIIVSAAELVSRDDPEGALLLLSEADVPPVHIAEAALKVFAFVMSGDGAAARFDELRAITHQLAVEVGADDRQVVLNLEVVGAAQAVEQGDLDVANSITSTSEFTSLDHAHVAVALTGQAVAGWVGSDRAPGVFSALRRHHGIEAA